jgi:hypothetical protein
MTDQGIKIVERDGVVFLSGVLNEYADFSPLLKLAGPLQLDMKDVSRLNSIGIRNLLKFLSEWGAKPFEYLRCPSEFVDQVNMIPALLGAKGQGKIASLFVPYECADCEAEEEVLAPTSQFEGLPKGGEGPKRACGKCGGQMSVLTDSFFVFLQR